MKSNNSMLKSFLKKIKNSFFLLQGRFSNEILIKTKEDIEQSKYFCMVPWVHLHVMPDSSITPCCLTPYDEVYGNAKQKSLKNIWNNKMFKTMRKLKLMDRPVHSCRKCYEVEESGILSMRKRMNHVFENSIDLINSTEDDGYLPEPKMKYLDLRFSNICNFKCRGCSPTLSTKWFEDHQKLWDYKSEAPKLINFIKDKPPLWEEIENYLPDVEHAYFAGGEPLLMDEHYKCLEKFIELNKTDVVLNYNTNLSILKFKKYDLLELWSHFPDVHISVSLDDIKEQGEYFRSGLKWQSFLENCLVIKKAFPHFQLSINCTISVFNIHRIPEIHQELFSKGVIDAKGFNFNPLLDPPYYRSQILPPLKKQEITKKLYNYANKLNEAYPDENWGFFISDLKHQIKFMNSEDKSHLIPEFKKITLNLDKIRSEDFTATYPELGVLVQ